MQNNQFIKKILDDDLVISGFQQFKTHFMEKFQEVKEDVDNKYQYGITA